MYLPANLAPSAKLSNSDWILCSLPWQIIETFFFQLHRRTHQSVKQKAVVSAQARDVHAKVLALAVHTQTHTHTPPTTDQLGLYPSPRGKMVLTFGLVENLGFPLEHSVVGNLMLGRLSPYMTKTDQIKQCNCFQSWSAFLETWENLPSVVRHVENQSWKTSHNETITYFFMTLNQKSLSNNSPKKRPPPPPSLKCLEHPNKNC